MKFINTKLSSSLKLLTLSLAVIQVTACVPFVFGTAGTGASLIHDRRTAGTIIDDQGIEMRILHEVGKEPFYHDIHLTIVSYNNNVLLLGQVPTQANKATIQEIAESIPKARKIYNEITIGPSISMGTRAKDGYITSKIKARLIANRDIDPTRVKVVTENANVYLLGIVSNEEAAIATREAEKVSGVYRITRLFEYAQIERLERRKS